MEIKKHVDIMGIGLGPFNLGLATLIEEGTELTSYFVDKQSSLQWHPGMLIEMTDLQVPFIADLVTFANPKSEFTFLNYLHEQGRLYAFYYFNRFDIPRKEYNAYLQWVASKLLTCQFNIHVDDVSYDTENEVYHVSCTDRQTKETFAVHTRHLVMGTGTVPAIPGKFKEKMSANCIHSSEYLPYEKELKKATSITVVGSGQSAAEIFYDLLYAQEDHGYELSWFTRSAGFFQMEEGKLGIEMFSPDFTEYFHQLPYSARKEALPRLEGIRNGVQVKTLKNIYDLLYHRSIGQKRSPAKIRPTSELKEIKEQPTKVQLTFHQWQTNASFEHQTEKLVLATGYKPNLPEWFLRMSDEMQWESETEFAVELDGRVSFKDKRQGQIFALTNVVHAHGTSATNLALAVQRNQRIIHYLTDEHTYPISKDNTFTTFE
ncbi:lysine N(6)-hydroxylase/L-ornithine N(5)-oxygenase family protein [Alkalicoccobacillus porphyridii]|uniref:L-lysine N6-monooxygenase MbtG n=1 Tax=Alkalicoccobacillus porphyridii TaxID=2597270 RepID=A0A553ZV76_9BACI|nr:SidA/IucD/PvdA family monooxygenase [Alkalicoccobacillus porphyridii]TSB45235.1 ornithine monooxygenase [Alkalicoccobacillus porphyridii]